MTISYGNTKDLGGAIKGMVYAPAGYGKTKLISTAPDVFVISTEQGLLTIRPEGLNYMVVETMQDFRDAYTLVSTHESFARYKTIAIDSLTDIAESIVIEFKKTYKDPRQAYGQLNDELLPELRKWRNLANKNVILTCKQDHVQDGVTGALLYNPSMPGKVLPQEMPYWGDFLFAIRIMKNEDGTQSRFLQTQPDIQFNAKYRGEELEQYEPFLLNQPTLTNLFNKMRGQ